jgi:hypothetical protein
MRVHLHCSLRNSRSLKGVAAILGASTPGSPFATCPDCGTTQLRVLQRRDRIERISRVPWSTLQRFFGGRLYYCRTCRLQFYDCRKNLTPVVNSAPDSQNGQGAATR